MICRKNCSKCTRWRYLIDFSVRKWTDHTKTVPCLLQSQCKACRKKDGNALRAKPLNATQRKTRQASWRVHKRKASREQGVAERGPYVVSFGHHGSVRREPFGAWLQEKMDRGMSYRDLAQQTGVAQRLIRSYVLGYDYTGHHIGYGLPGRNVKARKLRAVDWVSLTTVDRALTAMNEAWMLEELYPLNDAITDD